MREIKFRAWHKKEKRIYPWNELIGSQIKWLFDNGDFEPMQYTELQNANRQEIYEGDILQDMTDSERTLQVK